MNYLKSNVSSLSATQQAGYDTGLRAYMISVYSYMAIALMITGFFAVALASSPSLLISLASSPLWWVMVFAPLGFAIFMNARFAQLSFEGARLCLFSYAALLGISLSVLFLIYTNTSIARVFLITAAVFGGMSLYGYTTKKDLSSMGAFLMMGVWGLIVASIVNLFLKSAGMHYIISFVGVLVFTGLTAYDVRKLKDTYYLLGGAGNPAVSKVAIYGALSLYMDFINLFVSLLHLVGDRRN